MPCFSANTRTSFSSDALIPAPIRRLNVLMPRRPNPSILERRCTDRHNVPSDTGVALAQSHFGSEEGVTVGHLVSSDCHSACDGLLPGLDLVRSFHIRRVGEVLVDDA